METSYEEKYGIHPKADYIEIAEKIEDIQGVFPELKLTVKTKDPLFMEVLKERGIKGKWKRRRQ